VNPLLFIDIDLIFVPHLTGGDYITPIVGNDRRELILRRLVTLLGTVNGTTLPLSVFRNRAEIPTEKLPALVLLDGREDLKFPAMPHTRGGARVPTVFDLKPQVFIVLRPRDGINNVGVGEELSGLRMQVIKAFIQDDELVGGLLGPNGEINYLGHETDLQTGSTVLGQMQLNFQLSYVFDPTADLN